MNYFDDPDSKHFSFESFADGLDDTTFAVINFTGTEAISEIYDFEIMLLSSNREIDLEEVLQAQAIFTIHRGGDDDVLYNGILAEFEQLHEANDVIFYRARLVPKLWWLNLTHHNQVFLDQSVPEIIEDALRDGGLESSDFDVSGLSGYEALGYSCQYDESHFNFVSRNMERQGIYYYFLQESDGEVLVLTDTKFSHEALKEGAELFYNPASGLEGHHLGEAVGSFSCRQKQLPAEIILKDYNYEKPSLDITSRADVDEAGRGVTYLYGEYFATPEEGERFAGIRAEELLCQKQVFHGESTVPYMMPGFTFNLNNHYRDDFNQEYLVLEVRHEGNQSHLMSTGIATESERAQNQAIYKNTFDVIPNEVQYRPERTTKKPKISGTIHAKIDSETDTEYAQVDEQGRYRVKLPFDINDDHLDGKGSAPVRMMQPYAGTDRGMQFPLVKGTEVLLTFIEGNPDRPVIAGAVSNPETRGPVNAENMSESVIQTGGRNRIRMEDKAGSQRMVLETPSANSWIRMGAHNDPIIMYGDAMVYVDSGDAAWQDHGAIGWSFDSTSRQFSITHIDPVITDATGVVVSDFSAMISSDGLYTLTYTYTDSQNPSNIYEATRAVVVGDTTGVLVGDDANGIRLHSAGGLWLESKSRQGRYVGDKPVPDILPQRAGATEPNQTGDLLSKFGSGASYNPTNLLPYTADSSGNRTAQTMDQATSAPSVFETSVSSMDTFTTQEGNIYDFGGYWNYNLGNSYAENHMDQDDTVELNKTRSKDLLDVGGPYPTTINWPTSTPGMGSQDWDPTAGGDLGVVINNDLAASDTTLEPDPANPYFNTDGSTRLWIEKSFGHSYEYREGDSISVSKGNTLEVSHGGHAHIEVKYSSNGNATYWSRSKSGVKKEKKWIKSGTLIEESTTTNGVSGDGRFLRQTVRKYDRNTGDLYHFSSSQGTGMGTATFLFDYGNTTSANFKFALDVSTTTNTALLIQNENYIAGKIKVASFGGAALEVNGFAGIKATINGAVGMIFESKNDKYELTFPALDIEGETNKISLSATEIKTLQAQIKAQSATVDTSTAKVKTPAADVTV